MLKPHRISNRAAELFNHRTAEVKPLVVNALADGEAEVLLYQEIGWFGVTAKMFADALAGIDAKTIHLRINSPGGDVFDGLAMYNTLKRQSAKVIVTVDGLAASAASFIAMAGSEVRMAQGSFMMIHNAWGVGVGNATDLRDLADTLDKVDTSIAGTYASKSGRKAETFLKLMAVETWFTAQEAVDNGLADSLDNKPAAKAAFDLSIFNNVPDDLKSPGFPKPESVRDLETLLRDAAGMSAAESKRFIAGLRSPNLRDEDMAGLADTIRKSLV